LLRMIDLAIQRGAEGLRGLGQRRQSELPQRGPVVRHGLADLEHGPGVVARHALDRARPASAAQHVISAAGIACWPRRPWRCWPAHLMGPAIPGRPDKRLAWRSPDSRFRDYPKRVSGARGVGWPNCQWPALLSN